MKAAVSTHTLRMSLAAPPFVAAGACFSPADVAGLGLWLKTDIPEIEALANGDPIAAWPYQSGHGRAAAQATLAKRPTRAAVTHGGKTFAVVRFDGVDDLLSAAVAPSAARTLILVAHSRSGPSGHKCLCSFANSASIGSFAGSADYRLYLNQAGAIQGLGGEMAAWQVVTLRYSGVSALTPFFNGAAGTTLDPSDAYAGSAALWLGGEATNWFGDYDLTEVLDYGAALSEPDRTRIESYLMSKWGIT